MDIAPPPPKLLERLRQRICAKGYSRRTEATYCFWSRRYILFHGKRHPAAMGAPEVEAFLTYLADIESISASAQNQALAALHFLYKELLNRPLPETINAIRAKKRHTIPAVLSEVEVRRLLAAMSGTLQLMAELTYGAGLRLQEVHRLRVQDIDFASKRIMVADGKGGRDRMTLLPATLVARLQAHLVGVRTLHVDDLLRGYGSSVVPSAYARRELTSSRHLRWQFVFPSRRLFHDEVTGVSGRWHVSPSALQRAVRTAAGKAGIVKRVGVHTLRHSFATHLVRTGFDIRRVQALLGHRNITTTMIYAHIVDNHQLEVRSPLDAPVSTAT